MIFVKPKNFSQVWHLIVMNCQIFEVEMKETPNVGNIFVPWILSERTLGWLVLSSFGGWWKMPPNLQPGELFLGAPVKIPANLKWFRDSTWYPSSEPHLCLKGVFLLKNRCRHRFWSSCIIAGWFFGNINISQKHVTSSTSERGRWKFWKVLSIDHEPAEKGQPSEGCNLTAMDVHKQFWGLMVVSFAQGPFWSNQWWASRDGNFLWQMRSKGSQLDGGWELARLYTLLRPLLTGYNSLLNIGSGAGSQ